LVAGVVFFATALFLVETAFLTGAFFGVAPTVAFLVAADLMVILGLGAAVVFLEVGLTAALGLVALVAGFFVTGLVFYRHRAAVMGSLSTCKRRVRHQ
jgi:hypothetical protein